MNVSLTKHQKEFIKSRLRSHQYQSASEIVREALRVLENLEFDHACLEREIQRGLQSGPAIPVTRNYWKQLKSRLHAEHAQR